VLGPVGLSVQGRYMYVANNADNSINIFDISSSTAPLMLASTTLTNAAQPIYFAQQGRNMFVASNGAGSFYLTALTVGGIDTNAINTGLLDATDANISGTLNASGDINAKGLNVGLSGLVSYGQLSLLGIATSTAGLGTTTIGASIYIASSTPATTTNSLYQQGGTLYWNGTTIGLSAYLSSNLVAATPYANNLSLGGGANTSMRISATTTAFLGITGFATSTVSNGTIITITNASSTGSFVLYNQSASSTAGNRIITGTGGDITIPSDASVELKYDGISLAWRVLGNWGANPGATTVTNVSATTTLSTWGRTIIVDASSGPFTITLPNPTLTSGGIIEFKRTDSTTNAVTIDGYASSTIDGSISVDLPNGNNSMIIRSDGTNAKILGGSGGAGGVMSYARLVKNTTTAINLQNTMNFNFDAVEYSNGLTANATTDTITVNRSGRYRIDFYTSPQSLAADHSISVYVNGVQNGTTTMIDFNTADNIVSMTFERDLLAGDVVAIRGDGTSDVIDFAGVASGVNSYFAMTQISASSLVTGQSVDYVLAKKTAIQTITNAADQGSVTWQSTAGNIPLVSGTTTLFQLSAGKTYKLEGHLAICNAGSGNCADSGAGTGGGRLRYKWVDSTNTPVGSVNTIGITKTTTGTTDSNGDTNALAIFTPTTDTQVKLYVFDVDTSNMIITYGTTTSPDASSDTYASIEQIGSSATTEYENNIYGDYPTGGYVATGTLSQYTNFIQVAQTTVGQTLLLPTPANQNLARLVYVDNTGSADFSMYSPNGTANVAAGESAFFKWNGSAWKSLTNATALAAEYGTTVLGVSPTTIASGVTNFATSQSLMTFTLPSAGVYEVQTSIRGFTNSIANNAVNVAIADPSANLVTNSEMLAAFSNTTTGFSSNAEGTVRITATSAGTYTVKVWNTNNTNSAQIYSDGNGRSAVNWKKISGYIPVIGQSVDYIHAKKSTAQNNVADESDITFQTSDGNMNLAGNTTITLYAGKTYSLSAELYVNYGDSDVGDSITISWVDANTGVAYASAQSIIVTTNTTVDCDAGGTSCSDEASIQDISPLASVTLTPTVDTQVSLRVKSTTGTADIPSGYMLIQQLGSTNIVSGFSFSSFVAAIASQIVDNTNFAQIWNWSTATSTNALTMSAPALTTGNLLVLNSSSTSGNALLVNGLASFNGTSTFASTTFSGTVGIGTSTNRYGGLLTKGLTLNNSLVLASSTALSTTSLALYNSNGTLMWNGTALATNSSLPASTTSLYVGASGAVSVGTSTTGTSSTLFIQGTSSNANALTIQGNVSNLINTSLPPIQVATNTSTSSPQSVTIYGKYMFNANFTTGNINITDISNPTNPKKISSIATGAGATDVKVSGRYAYVTNFNVPSLSVVDIGNIFAPTVVGSVTIGAGAGYSAIYGNYVLTSNQTAQTMSVISVANPASPVVVATASLGTLPGPITVHGKYAYVVNATTGNFQIFDLSNPINPTLISSPTLAGARAIAVAGRFAYVSGSSNTLAVFDVANPSSASQVGTISLPTGGILGMAVSGRYVYMAASSGKLIVADIASSTSPTILTSTTVGTASANIRDVAVSGRYAYLANSGDSSIAIVDLSGAEFANITAGTLSVGNIISDGSMSLLGGLTVGTNINVGTGGINSYGGINVMGTTSISSIMGRLTVGTTTSNSSFGLQAISTSSPIFTLASSTGANVLTVSAAGNVGIATSSPSTKLAIQYSAAFGGSTAGVGAVEIVNTDASLNGARITLANANGSRAWITGDGQNGLYVTVGSAGVSLATGGTSWVAVSDARLKSNVLNLNASSSVLEKIDGLRPVTYDLYNGNHEVGFIAQEVLPFFPELVTLPKNASSTCSSDNQDGCFKLNYDRFAVVALQGLKELNAKIFGTNDVQAISIEEITASSTISFDDKLKALGVNAKNVNDMLAQLASSTSATSSVTTTETVNTSTQTLSCNANNAVGESMSGGIVTAITSTTTPIAVEGQIPQTIYSCVVTTYATTTTTVEDLTFVGKLIARIVEEVKTYLASATSVFISKVETNEICVKKADGTPVCLNAEQLEGIKNSLNSAPQSPAAPPTAPEPLTCTDEQTLDENTNTCVDNVPTSLPEEPEIPENPPAEIPASP
jgi:hypothetical protein